MTLWREINKPRCEADLRMNHRMQMSLLAEESLFVSFFLGLVADFIPVGRNRGSYSEASQFNLSVEESQVIAPNNC